MPTPTALSTLTAAIDAAISAARRDGMTAAAMWEALQTAVDYLDVERLEGDALSAVQAAA